VRSLIGIVCSAIYCDNEMFHTRMSENVQKSVHKTPAVRSLYLLTPAPWLGSCRLSAWRHCSTVITSGAWNSRAANRFFQLN